MLRNMTTIYIRNDNKFLMLYRIGSVVVQPSWCGVGGHFEENELNNPQKCVLRELFEETGIHEHDIDSLELRYVTLRLKNKEIRQNYYFFADLKNQNIDMTSCDEGKLEWINEENLLDLEMPFTAKECLKHYLSIGQFNKVNYAGIAEKDGVIFTELSEF